MVRFRQQHLPFLGGVVAFKVGDIVRYIYPQERELAGIVIELYHPKFKNGKTYKKLLAKVQLFNDNDPTPYRSLEMNNTNWEVLNG